MTETEHDTLIIGSHVFPSRLIVGTAKYRSVEETGQALIGSGAEVITLALRRVEFKDRSAGFAE